MSWINSCMHEFNTDWLLFLFLGEYEFLACDSCLNDVAKRVKADMSIENAVRQAAGNPTWWDFAGNIDCNVVAPVGRYIVYGVAQRIHLRKDIVVSANGIVHAKGGRSAGDAVAGPARRQRRDLMSALDGWKPNTPIPLSTAASLYTEDQLDELLSGGYDVIFLLSSTPCIVKLELP